MISTELSYFQIPLEVFEKGYSLITRSFHNTAWNNDFSSKTQLQRSPQVTALEQHSELGVFLKVISESVYGGIYRFMLLQCSFQGERSGNGVHTSRRGKY